MKTAVLLAAAAAIAVTSCGKPSGEDWLIRTDADTISVREAGANWRDMDPSLKEDFLKGPDPVASWLQALARKTILESEAEASGILSSSQVKAFEDAFARTLMFQALLDSLPSGLASACTEEDVDFYRSMMGRTVWFTDLGTGISHGPRHLPEIEREFAEAIDTALPGDVIEVSGTSIRLDSVHATERYLVEEALADTAAVRRMAVSRLSSSEADRILTSAVEEALRAATIDTSLLHEFAAFSEDSDDAVFRSAAMILESPVLALTVGDLRHELAFSSSRMPVSPGNPVWLQHYLRSLLRLSVAAGIFEEGWPDAADGILESAERFGLETALDELYFLNVISQVEVTDSMLLEEYSLLPEPPLHPPRRVLEMGRVPEDRMIEVRTALSSRDEARLRELLLPFSGHAGFEEGSLISGPITRRQVPDIMGGPVFATDPDDTLTWHGPSETQLGTFVLYRNVRTLEDEPMTFEESKALLESRLRARLEEDVTREWMRRLEESRRMEINYGLLEDLPEDPAIWTEL